MSETVCMCVCDRERFHCSVPEIIIHVSMSPPSHVHHERSCVSALELVSVTKHVAWRLSPTTTPGLDFRHPNWALH